MRQQFARFQNLIFLSLFLLVAGLLLTLNSDLLYMAQQRSLFMTGSKMWNDCLREVGGMLIWTGRAGTLLFHYPLLGILLLLMIWSATYCLLRRAFVLPRVWGWLHFIPMACLLVSITGIGYWFYYLKNAGFWLTESVGLLCVTVLLQPITICRNERFEHLLELGRTLLVALVYPLLGWYATLTLCLLALRQLLKRQWMVASATLLCLVFAPWGWAHGYTTLRLQDAWMANFPHVTYNDASSSLLTGTFLILTFAMILLCLIDHYKPQGRNPFVALTGMLLTLGCAVGFSNFDANFHAELRMHRALQEYRWEEVLKEMEETAKGPTRQMVCCKNLALLHTHRLTTHMFAYNNIGPAPKVADSLNLHMIHTIGPLLYLYHGMANDATRWTIENSVEWGFSVADLKVLTLAAIISNEQKLAHKYLDMLSRVPFEQDFVRTHYPLVANRTWRGDDSPLARMCRLHDDLGSDRKNDTGNVEWRIYLSFAEQEGYQTAECKEIAFVYALMLKKPEIFWPQLYEYVLSLKGKPGPMLVQEVAYLVSQLDPDNHPETDFHFPEPLKARYQTLRRQRHPSDDHSYWYFYYYCNDVQPY